MMVREIKVVYFDGSPVVYDDGERLNEKEIVDLMVEYMEENHELHKEIIDLKISIEQLNSQIEHLQVERDRERNATAKQHKKWDKEAQDEINHLHEENQTLKTRFHEEKELAMRLSRECDTLTIKKQELELEINRLETIIKTGKKELI